MLARSIGAIVSTPLAIAMFTSAAVAVAGNGAGQGVVVRVSAVS